MIMGMVVRMVVVVSGHRGAFLNPMTKMRQRLRHHVLESEEHSIGRAVISAKQPDAKSVNDRQEYPMSATTDKIKGHANEAMGKAKQGIGEVTGSEKLQAEGLAQEAKGDVQKGVGNAKQTVKDAADKL